MRRASVLDSAVDDNEGREQPRGGPLMRSSYRLPLREPTWLDWLAVLVFMAAAVLCVVALVTFEGLAVGPPWPDTDDAG
jgi:hypothetical protein